MKPLVLASRDDAPGVHYADVLAHGDGSFGSALCCRDPEDGSDWRHLDDPAAARDVAYWVPA